MSTQGDLFALQATGLGQEEREAQSPEVVPPNPLDGYVHQVKEVTTDKGSRIIVVKCGATMPKFRTRDRLAGASIWNGRVTCPACKLPPCPPSRGCPSCKVTTPGDQTESETHP